MGNGRALKPTDLKRLEGEERRLKETVLNQALLSSELKDELGLRECEAQPAADQPSAEVDGESEGRGREVGRGAASGGAAPWKSPRYGMWMTDACA